MGDLRGRGVLLQSGPITTIDDDEGSAGSANEAESQPLGAKSGVADGGAMESQSEAVRLSGLGSARAGSPAIVRIVDKLDHLDKVEDGDIIVTEMTMPDMVPAMKRATASSPTRVG